jgi:membrane-associated phospholipid phosphatase
VLAFVLPISAAAQQPHELRNTSGWFLAGEFVGTTVISFVGPDLIVPAQPETITCADAWCETNGFDVAINKAFAAEHAKGVGAVSHVFTVGLVPLVGFAGVIVPAIRADEAVHGLQDAVIILDSFVLATGLNSVAKIAGRRQRPAFHYGREANTEAAHHPGEEFVSFYSGDTTWAFAVASSAVTLSALRGHETTRYLAIGAGTLALAGGTMRVVADMHWATDVLVGAAAGTAVGVAVPLLLHGRKRGDDALDVTVDPGARLFRVSGTF